MNKSFNPEGVALPQRPAVKVHFVLRFSKLNGGGEDEELPLLSLDKSDHSFALWDSARALLEDMAPQTLALILREKRLTRKVDFTTYMGFADIAEDTEKLKFPMGQALIARERQQGATAVFVMGAWQYGDIALRARDEGLMTSAEVYDMILSVVKASLTFENYTDVGNYWNCVVKNLKVRVDRLKNEKRAVMDVN